MTRALMRLTGVFTLGAAGFVLLLFIMNIRSQIYHHGPNWSFLFWPFLYCAITGIGLVRLRKWAVISLFLPGIAYALMLISDHKILIQAFPAFWVLFNVAFSLFLVGIPAVMLLGWKELHWKL